MLPVAFWWWEEEDKQKLGGGCEKQELLGSVSIICHHSI